MKFLPENNLAGRLKSALRRLDERQREAMPARLERVTEEHTCEYCGETFTGRYCPQCSTDCQRSRLTFRNAVLNVLDVWGLGNRPMFGTIKELFWRPGYMIRDYLRGRQQAYFPPVKMLFLLSMFLLLEANLLGVQLSSKESYVNITEGPEEQVSEKVVEAGNTINAIANSVIEWVFTHPAQMTIIQCLIIIFIIARIFRNSPAMGNITRTEAFFTQIYVECQSFVILILCMPLYVLAHRGQDIQLQAFTNAVVPLNILMYVVDFKQLFQFSFKQTIWKIIKLYLVLFVVILAVVFLGGIVIGYVLMSAAGVV